MECPVTLTFCLMVSQKHLSVFKDMKTCLPDDLKSCKNQHSITWTFLFPDDPFLYIVDPHRQNIFRMSTSGGPHIPVNKDLQLLDLHAIAHDPVHKYIYWTGDSDSSYILGRISLESDEMDTIPLNTGEQRWMYNLFKFSIDEADLGDGKQLMLNAKKNA